MKSSKKKIKLVKRRKKEGGATTAAESPSRNSNALNKLKRFIRSKRGGVKVHPIIRKSDGDDK